MDTLIIKEILCIAMFVVLCGTLLMGFPVAFTLAGTALIFAGISWLFFGIDLSSYLSGFPQRILANEQSEVLLAVPLFVFMGVMLERSKVAEELLDNMGRAFGPIRGGLAISVCVVGALLAASTGIVGATVVTMGLLSLPTMLRRGYGKSLTCGTIAASGTLGQIIPPSIVLVLLGDQLATAYQNAQLKLGNFSPDTVSVNDLFAGALFPGLVLVGMYIVYIVIVTIVSPKSAPAIPPEIDGELSARWGSAKQISSMSLALAAVAVALLVFNAYDGYSAIGLPSFGAVLSDTTVIFTALFLFLMLFGARIEPEKQWPIVVGFVSYAAILIMAIWLDLSVASDYLFLYILFVCGVMYGAFSNAWRDAFWGKVLRSLIPPLVLIVAVLGSILGGLASPTEAAGVGAVGAIMLAGYRLNKKDAKPVLIGGLCLVLILILTAHFDLRMQRTTITAVEWVAIVAAILLSLGLTWGVIVSVVSTSTHRIDDGEISHGAELHARRVRPYLMLLALLGATLAIAARELWIMGGIVLVVVVWGLWSQWRAERRAGGRVDTVLSDVVRQTMEISSMVFIILVGAGMFALVFRGLGGDVMIEDFLKDLPGGSLGAMLVVMAAMFLLGFFLDFLEIVFIVVPIVSPILLQMEFNGAPMNPVWLGVMMAVNLQTSYLTPPFGFALFYLRGVAPPEVTTMDIYRGIVPFVLIQVLSLVVLWNFPGLATWLPTAIFGP